VPRVAESWSPEDGRLANVSKQETLRRRLLERQARGRGFELRHTTYGYALIDAARTRVDDRNDMTLDDVESWLARAGTSPRG
jgi:hypothetical protein